MYIYEQAFVWAYIFISLGLRQRGAIVVLYSNWISDFLKTCNTFYYNHLSKQISVWWEYNSENTWEQSNALFNFLKSHQAIF